MKAMKGRFLKKLNIISTIKRGLSHQHPEPGEKIPARDDNVSLRDIPDLLKGADCVEDEQEDVLSSSMESVLDDFEDADSSSPESVEFPLSGREVSTDSETYSPRNSISGATMNLKDKESFLPEGGAPGSVVFYTTSLGGIRKTFEDCSRVKFLLRSFRVKYEERDVSMHREYREALWKVSGGERAVPPKLFVHGRLIGGADEVIGLHERGELKGILDGIPRDPSFDPCVQCGDFRFMICSNCSGSCRIIIADTDKRSKCSECNENGLVRCPIC